MFNNFAVAALIGVASAIRLESPALSVPDDTSSPIPKCNGVPMPLYDRGENEPQCIDGEWQTSDWKPPGATDDSGTKPELKPEPEEELCGGRERPVTNKMQTAVCIDDKWEIRGLGLLTPPLA